MSEQEEQGYDMYGIQLFRNESTSDQDQFEYPDEADIEFLDDAKKHYNTVREMVGGAIEKIAQANKVKVKEVSITIQYKWRTITYGFKTTGKLIAIFDNTDEYSITYSPE